MSAAYDFVQQLAALDVPIYTAPPGAGEFTGRPAGWSTLTTADNTARIAGWRPGDALCGLMGGRVAVVDVDPRNGGDVDAVRAALDGIGARIYGDVLTPGGGRHFYLPGHPDLPTCHKLQGFGGVDVQSYGAVAYLPGTQRPKYDGAGYVVMDDNLAALADGGDDDSAEALAGWVAEHRAGHRETFEPAAQWTGEQPARREAAYLAATLRNLAARIASMGPDSGRNVAVYQAGLAVGNYVAGAGMDETEATTVLTAAAGACGLVTDDGELSVLASIRSGIKNGKVRPRAVPDAARSVPPPATVLAVEHPLEALLAHVRRWHELDDLSHVLFGLACAVSAHDQGEPLWGMIVGAPSSGKTETVRMLDGIVDDRLDELTAAGLLSWSRHKTPKPVGILSRVGTRAFVSVGDFSTVLAMSDRGARDMLFALLRRAYDGAVTRDLGNAPVPLRWEGRLTFLTAVTPVIDNYTAHADALGPRWLYLRMPEQSTKVRRRAAARSSRDELEANRATARALAAQIVEGARLRLDDEVDLDQDTRESLADVAVVVCAGRGAVPREGYGRREVNGMAVVEEPHRLVAQLHALTHGALAIGVEHGAAVRLARRAALDTVPRARLAALEVLSAGEALTVGQVAERGGLHRQVARMALEDLREVRVTCCPIEDSSDVDDVRELGTKPRDWQLTDDLGHLAADVLREQRRQQKAAQLDTKSSYPPPDPPIRGEEDRGDVEGEPTFRVESESRGGSVLDHGEAGRTCTSCAGSLDDQPPGIRCCATCADATTARARAEYERVNR